MGVKKKSRTKGIKAPVKRRPTKSGGKRPTIQGKETKTRSDELKEQIWQVVSMIPKGSVASYGQIAKLIGYPSHARFVGTTLKNLPKGSKLPWYRVVNSSLRISQRGGGEARQRKLLEAEDVTFIGDRIARTHKWET